MPQKVTRPPSRKWVWIKAGIIVALGMWAALFVFPNAWNRGIDWVNANTPLELPRWQATSFRLGLDLLGGSELVYEADVSQIPESERDAAMDGVRDVIERRVNALGVAEPVVQVVRTSGTYRVVVQLAGVRDVNEAIREIGETPVLEFKETATQAPGAEDAYAEALAKAETKRDEVVETLRRRPRISLDLLADATSETVADLGFVSKSTEPAIWQWADEHGVGARTTDTSIDDARGWHFIEVTDSRAGEEEIEASHILICWKDATQCTRETAKEEAREEIEELRAQVTPENFSELAKTYSTEPAAQTSGGSLGWFTHGVMIPTFEEAAFALRVGEISEIVETPFGFHLIYKTGERTLTDYYVRELLVIKPVRPDASEWANTQLSGKHLVRAHVEFDPNTGTPYVALTFNEEGKELFGDLTARNVGQPIGIFLDGGLISAPVVQSEIRAGTAIITGSFTLEDAKLLAQRLNAGALPVPIELVAQQTVGATLGIQSLSKSLTAGLVGFALVALFMILYYRIPGVVAVIALLIYTSFVLALFKLIPVTLTLAGIAGFILSMGMAVDANVLIFERMREELRAGRSLASAVEEGFRRAWTSIRDGNLTTIISALVLFWFSSSVIKGFALTLAIGVVVSMFSALTVTRVFLQLISAWRWKTKIVLFAPAPPAPRITDQS